MPLWCEGFPESVREDVGGGAPLGVDLPSLYLLTKPMVMYVQMTQFGGEL